MTASCLMQLYDSRIVNGFDFYFQAKLCAFFFLSEKLLTLNILGCDDASLHLSFKSSFASLNAAFTVWSGGYSQGHLMYCIQPTFLLALMIFLHLFLPTVVGNGVIYTNTILIHGLWCDSGFDGVWRRFRSIFSDIV